MNKGYYWFRECGALSKLLTIFSIISFVIAGILLVVNDIHTWHLGLFSNEYSFRSHHAWILFLVLLGVILILVNITLHKICRDIATLLKEIEDKTNNR